MWLVIVRQCDECGGTYTIRLFNKEPVKEDVMIIQEKAGGAYCQKTAIMKIKKEETFNHSEVMGFDIPTFDNKK